MRRSAARLATVLFLLLGVTGVCGSGCQAISHRFLSLVGLQKEPFSVTLVTDLPGEAAQAFNPFPAYSKLQMALAEHLGRPVAVDVCFPFQVESCLESAWYDLAVLTPVQYAGLAKPEGARVLAISVDKQGRMASSALLVVAAESELQSAAELRGRSVAFGPAGDVRTHYAALKLLADAGLAPADLAPELLPVPGSLKHLPDGPAVARAVIGGSAAAGFIDEGVFEALPEHDPQPGAPARDKLRVIARTVALPTRVLIASRRLDDATFAQLQSFALSVGTQHPEVMEPLTSSGFAAPTEEVLAACRGLARKARAAGGN